jgi:hypothetical protein
MLPSERRRAEEMAAREAEGESLWTDQFDARALVRLAEVWRIFENRIDSEPWRPQAMRYVVADLLRLRVGIQTESFPSSALLQVTDASLVQDLLAIVYEVVAEPQTEDQAELFAGAVNRIFNEHRIAHKFVEGELLPLKSDELHTEVVEPAIRLLVGSRFKGAHGAYMNALKEISKGEPADAITDAGTALQEALTALGCKGGSLGPLVADARKQGLLGAHDQSLISGVIKFHDWAHAERSNTGDAHKHSDAVLADAWLMVHVVGALIVRLADSVPRAKPEA